MGMAFNGFSMRRPTINPDQRFGDGFDPVTGTMSLSGGSGPSGPLPAIDALPPVQPTAWQRGGKGWNTVGGIGDILAALGGKETPYVNHMMEEEKQQQLLQRQMMLAQWKNQHPDPTGTMQNVQAAGLQPGTPEYQAFMQKVLMQPRYMVLGNPESGQQVIDPSQMNGSAMPAPPKVGEVQDGHVYMGGDPANPASWKAQ